jgi:hypothetical protein
LRSQLKHRIAQFSTKVLNEVAAEDFVNMNLFGHALYCERVWKVIQRWGLSEGVSTLQGSDHKLLAVFALENGWVWEGRGCDEKSALAFENKVDIVFLFVLLRDKIALGVDDFHE